MDLTQKNNISTLLCFIVMISSANCQSAEQFIKQMHETYNGKWYSNMSFVQTTENYRNDSLIKTSTWYEYIQFPDKLRIDFDKPNSGNAVLYTADSTFIFRKHQLSKRFNGTNDLMFVLGGLYFYPYDTVIQKFKRLGYNIDASYTATFKGKDIFVIGAQQGDTTSKQVWIDSNNFNVLRMIQFHEGQKEDILSEQHTPLGNGWTETKISFYFDDNLFQIEYYNDCKIHESLNPALFNPNTFWQTKWRE